LWLLAHGNTLFYAAWMTVMTNANPTPLKQALFDAYEGFADKRIKHLDRGDLFIVDDRQAKDHGADKKLYGWFVQIFAQVLDADTIKLSFRGDLPTSENVERWFGEHGAEDTNFGREVLIKRGAHEELGALAAALVAIVRPGAHYPVASWKYVCPRTAGSLRRLDRVLSATWVKN
jgi:hypothetical protein